MRISDWSSDVCSSDLTIVVHKLHGSLDPADQRAAIRAAEAGMRKVILATSIAETSLTIDGVRIVIDSGLARRPRYDRAAGLTRLVTDKRSEEHTSELQSLMRISYAVFCLQKKTHT